jgi:acyl-CoA synthetase (AMP-forming)/AMP-acid ligase II
VDGRLANSALGTRVARMRYGARWTLHFLQGMKLFRSGSRETVAWQLERHAQRHPQRPFLLYADRRYTYGEANAIINRHAHAYRAMGIRKGDVVAIAIENRPEFLWHFFGLLKLGAVASLINTHAQRDGVLHALRSCGAKHLTVGSEIWPRLAGARSQLEQCTGGSLHVDVDPDQPQPTDLPDFAALTANATQGDPPETQQQTLADVAALIYTSGTTGLPKAAIVRHERLFRAGRLWASAALRFVPGDVHYNCLPLYHSNAVMLATGSVVTAGVTMALARRFSAKGFWEDIRRYQATSFIYIGEVCRYLINAPPSARDREHSVRVMSGNGLRPDVWSAFQARFGISRVAEFYGATEGNCVALNYSNVVGSCGTLSSGMAIVRWDEQNQDFIRDARGFLVRVRPNEVGLLLGKIRPDRRFDGYTDREASEQKIVRGAFKRDDAWFVTGDLLRHDGSWRLFFVDRLGDTFRWKGENVATHEVEEQITRFEPVEQAAVYGVRVPGAEGRAGMATMVLRRGVRFDPDDFCAHVRASLPGYARPIFVRIAPELTTTGTHKISKTTLQKEGFDLTSIRDPVYLLHPDRAAYIPLDQGLQDAIARGQLRL